MTIQPHDGTDSVVPAQRGDVVGIVGPLVAFAMFIGLWYVMHSWGLRAIFDRPGFLMPAPHDVVKESFLDWDNLSTMLQGLRWTTTVAVTGLAIAIVIGMGLAIVMSQSRTIERALWPLLVTMQTTPILALVPIIISVAGVGMMPRVYTCVLIALFPIVANTLFGLLSAEAGQHDLFTLQRASRITRLRKLQLPAAMPAVVTGLRTAAGLAVIGAIIGEQLFVRGDKGIGILMAEYRSRSNYPLVYGTLVLSALLGVAVFVFFGWLGRRVVGRWHQATRATA